jgi:hypothetical protein
MIQNEYQRMIEGAKVSGDPSSLYSFLSSSYLPFYKDFTGGTVDYNTIYNSITGPQSPIGPTVINNGGTDSGENIGSQIAAALAPYFENENNRTTNISITIGGREIANAVAEEIPKNENILSSLQQVLQRLGVIRG